MQACGASNVCMQTWQYSRSIHPSCVVSKSHNDTVNRSSAVAYSKQCLWMNRYCMETHRTCRVRRSIPTLAGAASTPFCRCASIQVTRQRMQKHESLPWLSSAFHVTQLDTVQTHRKCTLNGANAGHVS